MPQATRRAAPGVLANRQRKAAHKVRPGRSNQIAPKKHPPRARDCKLSCTAEVSGQANLGPWSNPHRSRDHTKSHQIVPNRTKEIFSAHGTVNFLAQPRPAARTTTTSRQNLVRLANFAWTSELQTLRSLEPLDFSRAERDRLPKATRRVRAGSPNQTLNRHLASSIQSPGIQHLVSSIQSPPQSYHREPPPPSRAWGNGLGQSSGRDKELRIVTRPGAVRRDHSMRIK